VTLNAPFVVLVYHSVRNDAIAGYERWTISERLFDDHVRAIADSGRDSLTVPELADALHGRSVWPKRPVVLTFDDGWDDTLRAVERLAAHDLKSTVYVTSDLVGRRAMLGTSGVEALAEVPGVEVGAHSVRHVRLDEISRDEAVWQIVESRARIAALTGRAVHSFAYPHGAHDARVREAVVAAGYTSAAAVKDALSHRADDPFAISRWTVMSDTPAARIEELMAGRSATIAPAGERIRTRAFRAVRRARRRLGLPEPEAFADVGAP
jgi:peptidoglycan/xylan/chitin deacetylase (PgdA/CDA1 family)